MRSSTKSSSWTRHQVEARNTIQGPQSGEAAAGDWDRSAIAKRYRNVRPTNAASGDSGFLSSLSFAWKKVEVRPTHRKKTNDPRWWRTRENPFAEARPVIEGWLSAEPSTSANAFMDRLAAMIPKVF